MQFGVKDRSLLNIVKTATLSVSVMTICTHKLVECVIYISVSKSKLIYPEDLLWDCDISRNLEIFKYLQQYNDQ